MTGYYRLTINNQAEAGTAANELFEIVPSTAKLTGIIINGGGGTDTIQVTDDNNRGFQATVFNVDPSSTIQLNGNTKGYYILQPDGIQVIDEDGKVDLKILGSTDTSIFNNGSTTYTSLNKNSTIEGQNISGTDLDDYIVINHQSCRAYGDDGDDTIVAYTDNNSLRGDAGDDLLIAYGNNSTIAHGYYWGYVVGNDTLVSNGYNNYLYDDSDKNTFIVGGNYNTAVGGSDVDEFRVYSYDGGVTNVTLTGGGNNDDYMISTGLVGVDGAAVVGAAYNPYTSDTVNVAITDFDSLDTIYIRDYGMNAINHAVGAEGTYIASDTGRVNILLPGQRDWNAVKDAWVTYDDGQGNTGVTTLELAFALPIQRLGAGAYVNGETLTLAANYVGHMRLGTDYNNASIVNIDATTNPQSGMFLAGNENANAIFAGYGGNFLWGGAGVFTTDYLIGGAGADIFMTGRFDGSDIILNAGMNDSVLLYDSTLSNIVAFGADAGSVALAFDTGNVVAVATTDVLSPTFQLADGSAYRFNRESASWQSA